MILALILFLIQLVFYLILFLVFILFLVLFGFKIWLFFFKTPCTCNVDLSGKTILITGGNAGLGFETAKILAKRGAKIVIASRNIEKSKKAAQKIAESSGNPNIEYKALDLSKLASVKQFVDDFNKSYDRLDVLINNAGMADKGISLTEDRIERTHQINHVGPTYLTKLLLDKLIASKPSRIVFVSSGAHLFHNFDPNDVTGEMTKNLWVRYSNDKLCNILVAKALSKILPDGVTANSLHPGLAKTEIFDEVPGWLHTLISLIIDYFFNTPEECSQTTVHLASAPELENVSGEYFNECKISSTWRPVTDELAARVWKDTIDLIEDRVKNIK